MAKIVGAMSDFKGIVVAGKIRVSDGITYYHVIVCRCGNGYHLYIDWWLDVGY